MIFTFWLTTVLVSSTVVSMPLKHARSSNGDADEMIGNKWSAEASKSNLGEDLGPVNEKRGSDNDADEMIGNIWNKGDDLGPTNMK